MFITVLKGISKSNLRSESLMDVVDEKVDYIVNRKVIYCIDRKVDK